MSIRRRNSHERSVPEYFEHGKLALEYARLRKIDSDWVRIQRQREVVLSAFEKCRENTLSDWNALINAMLPLVKTNIPESKVAELLLLLPNVPNMQTQQATLPIKDSYGSMRGMGGRSMFAVDFEANHNYLQEMLYPMLSTELKNSEIIVDVLEN